MNCTIGTGEYIEMSEYISPIPETLLTKVRLKNMYVNVKVSSMEQSDRKCMNCKHRFDKYNEEPCLSCMPIETQNWEEK